MLTRKVLIGLGIPTVFIPGLILASILGWNWKTDLAKLAARGGFYQSEKIFPKQAKVISIYDGDTILIDNGEVVRLIGVNAPDRGQNGYLEAGDFLSKEIENKEISLEYDHYQDDKYGRILAYVWEYCATCENNKLMVNWLLIKNGYAKVVIYADRRKLLYEDYLKSAETSL
jgi:endonuclease YncB( thermonuclease family)